MAKTLAPSGFGDYRGWADRLLAAQRANQSSLDRTIGEVTEYAKAVRDEECAREAGRWGADPEVIRQRSALSTAAIAHWRNEVAGTLGALHANGRAHLADLFMRVFRDVRSSQIRDAVREASYQADCAYGRDDDEQVLRWRNAEAALRGLLAEAEEDAGLDPAGERSRWSEQASTFVQQAADWAHKRQWKTAIETLQRSEDRLGRYQVPKLTIRTERGTVVMEPMARSVIGAAGRIDLYAYPTMFRVMLLRSPGNGDWRIRTDSGVFLRQGWNKQTFQELVEDLAAAS